MDLSNTVVTAYKDIYSTTPIHATLKSIVNRIRSGVNILEIINKAREERSAGTDNGPTRKSLPAICFSGIIPEGPREDSRISEHSGFAVMDFDHLSDTEMSDIWQLLISLPYVVCVFTSPSGDGVKAIVYISDKNKHREHYGALFKEPLFGSRLDPKNINPSRVCYLSYDPDVWTNYNAEPYTKILEKESIYISGVPEGDFSKFENILKWLEKQNEAFVSGSRNDYIFKLSSACCRFGIPEDSCVSMISQKFLTKDTDFTVREMNSAVKSSYKRNDFGSAKFEDNGRFIDKETLNDIKIDTDSPTVKDVIYGDDVYISALKIYQHGYESAETFGIPEVDEYFKCKRGEVTGISGIGNFGKTAFANFLMMVKSIKDDTKWGCFAPESYPAQEFYHDLVEMYLGCDMTPQNVERPDESEYKRAYDFVKKHFFYIHPKDTSPTPAYINSRFLELIMKEGIDGCVIDPYNQLCNDYDDRDDRYLDKFLTGCSNFAQINNIFYWIIMHPKSLRKDDKNGGYACPDIFDMAGGAMWNNKLENIIIYHRPRHHIDPMDRACEMHTKKIKRQKIVGKKGTLEFEYDRRRRQFVFHTSTPLNKPTGAYKDYTSPERDEPYQVNDDDKPWE